jgi:lipoate---protein ligase
VRQGHPARLSAIAYRSGEPAVLVTEFPVVDRLTGVFVAPTSSALVLGSTQRVEQIDHRGADAAGLPRVRRRSGGGGVVVRPGAQIWFDLFVPVRHHLANPDVAKAALVVGRLWADAIGPLLREPLVVHEGTLIETPWSRIDCFSGVGPGEVLLGGRKLVGVSQRRERAGTWFFSMAHLRFDPAEHAALADLTPERRALLGDQLTRDVTVLPLAPVVARAAIVRAVEALSE